MRFAWLEDWRAGRLADIGGVVGRWSGRLLFSFALLCCGAETWGATVTLSAVKDNTLLNDFLGDPGGGQERSNGQGPLYVGTLNRSPFQRRALVWFDVASEIPGGAIIESAELRLQQTASGPNPDDINISVYRVLADWGEAGSFAVGGTSAPAKPGDATWQYTFFNTSSWTTPGGRLCRLAQRNRRD